MRRIYKALGVLALLLVFAACVVPTTAIAEGRDFPKGPLDDGALPHEELIPIEEGDPADSLRTQSVDDSVPIENVILSALSRRESERVNVSAYGMTKSEFYHCFYEVLWSHPELVDVSSCQIWYYSSNDLAVEFLPTLNS